ncbi:MULTISPECIES: DUF1659 domain-containing protein [Peptostreptococcaceae]|uniref:DUF1659 domain-containing protein n=1 Tax=Peptostreptococcaceae TaxID=186804 RepID=UPI003F3FC1D0
MEPVTYADSVVQTKNPSSLKIKFDCGLGENGKTITRTRTYSSVKPTAAAVDVFNVAQSLVSLQKHNVLDVAKQDSTSLSE